MDQPKEIEWNAVTKWLLEVLLDPAKKSEDTYELGLTEGNKGLPARVKKLPLKEMWSIQYTLDFACRFLWLDLPALVLPLLQINPQSWKSFEQISTIYNEKSPDFYPPKGMLQWRNDVHFGFQRMCGPNHSSIELCKTIPTKLPVTDEMLKPFLKKGMTIEKALKKNRLFIVDLKLMKSLNNTPHCTDKSVKAICAPIGLFYYDKESEELKPVAIQLYQDPGEDNPIFLPSDPVNLWTWVKMWFNNADANYHQAIVHLGFTHLLMEGAAAVTHRYLKEDHRIFKLLIPHFHYLMAINASAHKNLINKDGFVDCLMSVGRNGAFTLIEERLREWRLDVDGTLPEDLKRRGLDDTKVLPPYFYRNDALKLYHVIKKYVDSYVKICYDTADKLIYDAAIQNWAKALVEQRAETNGGCGYSGVPGNGRLDNADQLVTIVTSFIFTCSVVHAGTNFPQYDHYGFPPNYPSLLKGLPPTTKADVPEQFMLQAVANMTQTLNVMGLMRLLSQKADHGLGDFEVDVQFDIKGPLTQFRKDLEKLEKEIHEANKSKLNKRDLHPYTHLLPSKVPNSIEI